jgi:hypothetical protein
MTSYFIRDPFAAPISRRKPSEKSCWRVFQGSEDILTVQDLAAFCMNTLTRAEDLLLNTAFIGFVAVTTINESEDLGVWDQEQFQYQ